MKGFKLSTSRNAYADLQSKDEFFLPNLCTVESVFLLVLTAELFVFVLVLAAPATGAFPWERLALTSLFMQWIVLVSAGLLCLARQHIKDLPLYQAMLICYCLVLLVTLVFSSLASYVIQSVSVLNMPSRVVWRDVGRIMLISAIVTGMVLRYFYVQHQLRQQQQAELQARLQALQSRIRPHFLFNSMNIIASLIGIDPEAAELAVEDLSDLFRASLASAGNQIQMTEELDLCRRYLRIEGLRLGERLHVNWHVGEIPREVKIPLLTLQPLLENAIYHGIQPLPEGGTININVSYEHETVSIIVSNPVLASSQQHASGNKMALDNIRSRLDALYGQQGQLQAVQSEDRYVTTLQYPYPITAKVEV